MSSTLYGYASVVAAIDSGVIASDAEERVLVVANSSRFAEASSRFVETRAYRCIADRFDRVVDLNELLSPYHPSNWKPRQDDLPLWEKFARSQWDIHDDVELYVESIQVRPASTLCDLFFGSPVTIYSDGLMSYGPTRSHLRTEISSRLQALIYVDLLPGLDPVLLREFSTPRFPIPTQAISGVFEEIAYKYDDEGDECNAITDRVLVLGQYLSALGILTRDEEFDLQLDSVRAASALGLGEVCLKVHPGAPASSMTELTARAAAEGIALRTITDPSPMEVLVLRQRPRAVIGSFSTGLVTANRLFDLPVSSFGTDLVLKQLKPFENSNRIPATIIDSIVPRLDIGEEPGKLRIDVRDMSQLQQLVDTVSFCMQPDRYPELRPTAVGWLAAQDDRRRQRYITRRRLTRLGLPGAVQPSALYRVLRRLHLIGPLKRVRAAIARLARPARVRSS